MSRVRVLASAGPGEVRVVAWDGAILDAAVWRPGSPDGVGDVHRGRVGTVVPAMAGAFVTLVDGEGFLPVGRDDVVREGDPVAVRVTRAAQGGKGPRLARVEMEVGAGAPALVARGMDAVTRLARLHPGAEVVVDDAGLAARLKGTIDVRVGVAFDDAVADAFEALLSPEASLPGGGRMRIETTAALTAVDIDLGAATGARGTKGHVQAGANAAAVGPLARAIRARDLSGAILVDWGGMPARRRAALAEPLRAALATDPLGARLLGFTGLGLAEIVRPRVHPPLAEVMSGPLAAGLEALRVAALRVAAAPHAALRLVAPAAIIDALRRDGVGLAAFADRAGRPLRLVPTRVAPALPWLLEDDDG